MSRDGAAAAPAAAPAETSDKAERVEVRTEDRLTLVGSYYAPRSSKQVSPGALLVHDAGGRRKDLAELAQRMQRQGFGVLVLDLRGHGESAAQGLEWSAMDAEERKRLWAFALRDLEAGSGYLRSQQNIHAASLTLVGHRAGATLAARHAVSDENVRSLALVDPQPQAEQYGFNLARDLEGLGGLPTYIAISRDAQESGRRMADAGHRANGGAEFIQLNVVRDGGAALLDDKRMAADVARWLLDKASPSRASR